MPQQQKGGSPPKRGKRSGSGSRRKRRRTVFEVKIRQGVVFVTANNLLHAERQARALSRDMAMHYCVRPQVEMQPGLFVLGQEAKRGYQLAAEVVSAVGVAAVLHAANTKEVAW